MASALAWIAIGSAALPLRGHAQSMPQPLVQFLQQSMRLTPSEMDGAVSGTPVVKVLESRDTLEVAVFGIVSIGVPRSFYVRRATDFATSLGGPQRRRFALFSDPAHASDVASFSLPHDDVADLARCRPGSCTVKLSAEAMTAFRASLDPAPPSVDSAANAFFRRRLVDYVTAYRDRGNAALTAYEDQGTRTAVARVFDAMLSQSPYVYQYGPSLERYLRNYPRDRPADLHEAIYWSEDDLPSLRPTLSLTHVVAYAPPEIPGTTLIASKQLYADHYLDGALELAAVVDRPADSAGVYLVLLRRLHFDNLPSGGLLRLRQRVVSGLRDRTTTSLRDAKTRSERAYAIGRR